MAPQTPSTSSLSDAIACGRPTIGAVHAGPFSHLARPLTAPMRDELAVLSKRLGTPITRDVPLDDIAFDPVGNPSQFAEACMVVRTPAVTYLLSIKTFYPRCAF